MNEKRVREILRQVKLLAAEYYEETKKPLGVTGEVAEYVAAQRLGLKLADARTPGYDALRGSEKIQIKGRICGADAKRGQRMSRIKPGADCDTVLLVLLDPKTLDPREMYQAPYAEVVRRLAMPGSKARNERGSMSVDLFKSFADQVFPETKKSVKRRAVPKNGPAKI